MKLSEIFEDKVNLESDNFRIKMNDLKADFYFGEGMEYTLDNLTPKILLDFSNFMYNYEIDVMSPESVLVYRRKDDKDSNNWILDNELIEEFLKQYKG